MSASKIEVVNPVFIHAITGVKPGTKAARNLLGFGQIQMSDGPKVPMVGLEVSLAMTTAGDDGHIDLVDHVLEHLLPTEAGNQVTRRLRRPSIQVWLLAIGWVAFALFMIVEKT